MLLGKPLQAIRGTADAREGGTLVTLPCRSPSQAHLLDEQTPREQAGGGTALTSNRCWPCRGSRTKSGGAQRL